MIDVLVNEIASRHRGAVVKMLGDGVHFHFRDPHDAVLASLEIVERVEPAGLAPAHIGVNAGPMIYDEGEYFGRAVNIAARIASQVGGRSSPHHAERVPPRRRRGLRAQGHRTATHAVRSHP